MWFNTHMSRTHSTHGPDPWSKYCKQQAKPEPGEKELGIWCARQVQQWGGILEQPAGSELFQAANLPMPGLTSRADSWSIEVWQAWWGYPMKKKTWLYFSNISPKDVQFPYALHSAGSDGRREQVMSKNQRSATTMKMAMWFIETIRNRKELL